MEKKQFDYNILLIGFMGTGKSTVSAYLKKAFDMDVIEMDQVIAKREQMSISDIFKIKGEEYSGIWKQIFWSRCRQKQTQ